MSRVVDVILSSVQTSKKTREDGTVAKWISVQGVMHLDGGRQEMFVDQVFPPRDFTGELQALPPGRYTLEPVVGLDYKTREPVARGFQYVPLKQAKAG